jgi:hypothetical protein
MSPCEDSNWTIVGTALHLSRMADVVWSATQVERHARARSRRHYNNVWIGSTGLIASLLALPLAQSSWHGPEVAAILAVAATSMLAGQRWAIATVVLAELMLAPTLAARGFGGGLALWPGRIAALAAMMMIVPGLLSLRRAAAALVVITGTPRTQRTCRRFHFGLVAVGALGVLAPMLT